MKEFIDRLQEALGSAYIIERELPLSGLGRLYLATDTAAGRQVSVQALPPDIAARLDINRFRAGMDRVARLRHRGIAPIIAAGAQDDIVWCVWPHPSGESLRYRLVRDGGLSAADSVQVLHDVSEALAYGHEQGVSHGDLKVDNIYIERGGAVIAEFGIRSALNQALGSASGGIDARADVHALAIAGQQMTGGRTGPVATAVSRALSIDPAEQITDAAAFRDALGTPPRTERRRLQLRVAVLAASLAVLAVVGGLVARQGPELDANLIAVAPFETLSPAHAIWREGLMTLLAANLAGAGPIRSVSPTIVVRSWEGQVDAQSAAAMGRRTGARLALYGRVVPMGGDSVRLQASLIDAQTGGTMADLELEGDAERLDLLSDTLTVQVLRELARTRPIGATRRASLGSTSLAALKAFLEGEQNFRRGEWDSAVAHYQRAIELDSTFAMALYRAGVVMGWQRTADDELSTEYRVRAGQYLRGVPLRDSLMIVIEALDAEMDAAPADRRYWENYRRLYAAAEELGRRFPRDPEAWYEVGEAYYHKPHFSNARQMLAAFDRAIAIDSAFAPAYIHPIHLALQLGDRAGALRYIDRYVALQSRDVYADAIRLTRRLLDPAQARSPQTQAVLDTASADLISATLANFLGWGDSMETSIRLARVLNTAHPSAEGRERSNSELGALINALAYHGRVREAWRESGANPSAGLLSVAAWTGALPPDSVTARLGRALREDQFFHSSPGLLAAPVLAKLRDTVLLRELMRRGEQAARNEPHPLDRALGRYIADAGFALANLARGDTAAAIAGLLALPDTACPRCVLYQITLAELLDARRADAEASRLLAGNPPLFVYATDGFWALYRARLAWRRGDREASDTYYRFVRDVWINADPELQRHVREAKAALARDRD